MKGQRQGTAHSDPLESLPPREGPESPFPGEWHCKPLPLELKG